MKRRTSYRSPRVRDHIAYRRHHRQIWWMHPVVLFTLILSVGSILMAIGLRATGLLP